MRRILLLASASACLFAFPARAAESVSDVPTAATSAGNTVARATEAELAAAKIERFQRAELNARMDKVLEESKKTLAGLQAMIDATTDPATLKDLEARMTQVKQGTTIDLLKVQSTFARENGRIEQADEIDAQIEAILNPKRAVSAVRIDASPRAAVAPEGGAR